MMSLVKKEFIHTFLREMKDTYQFVNLLITSNGEFMKNNVTNVKSARRNLLCQKWKQTISNTGVKEEDQQRKTVNYFATSVINLFIQSD